MAPWQLKEFMREKVERARRLLAEPGEHHGSADLQARTEVMGVGAEGQEAPRPATAALSTLFRCCLLVARC